MSLLSKIGPVGHFLAFWKIFRNPAVPWWSKLLFAAFSLGYIANPLDLIPDVIIGIGWIDDLLILPLLAWVFGKYLPGLPHDQRPSDPGRARR